VFGAVAFCLVGRVAQARWRTLRADLAEILRVPNRSPGPFLTDPMPPGFEMRASRQSGSAKKAQRRTTAKTKHRHTVIDPRRATTLTASSTFAGSNQVCVNAIASLSYNRVRSRT
jgi:hypothetical protein